MNPRKRFAEHPVRLEILHCLADGETLTIDQISAMVGRSPAIVKYHLRILADRDLVTLEQRA